MRMQFAISTAWVCLPSFVWKWGKFCSKNGYFNFKWNGHLASPLRMPIATNLIGGNVFQILRRQALANGRWCAFDASNAHLAPLFNGISMIWRCHSVQRTCRFFFGLRSPFQMIIRRLWAAHPPDKTVRIASIFVHALCLHQGIAYRARMYANVIVR